MQNMASHRVTFTTVLLVLAAGLVLAAIAEPRWGLGCALMLVVIWRVIASGNVTEKVRLRVPRKPHQPAAENLAGHGAS